jgi:predicted Zn-dependent peptidase
MDMLRQAVFPVEEMERERGVIVEEIRMYEDQPGQVAQERLNALLWPNHPLGRPLAGLIPVIEGMKRKDLLAYRQQFYHSGNLWITVAGKASVSEVEQALAGWLKNFPSGARPKTPRAKSRAHLVREVAVQKPIEQTHVALGFPAVSRHDPRRYALRLLSVILGENMSSRLFQVIREQHGLAYSIQSSCSTLADTGSFVVAAGVENAKFEKALKLTWSVLEKITQRAPSREELRRAKEYTLGQLLIGLESTTNQMMWMGESLMGYGRVPTLDEVVREMEAVTAEEIRLLAKQLFQKKQMHVVAVGPEVHLDVLKKV